MKENYIIFIKFNLRNETRMLKSTDNLWWFFVFLCGNWYQPHAFKDVFLCEK